ncbi:Threonine/homoserine efflux transporter RhtA OS=Bosea thiooxidans OX=53254 GN=SAMN05660750_04777 PE=4 SV=1 [Bosea thiooxidans]|uniref:Threonine/homoserine efflux transporter RhtA n=1 Tax=Bosea thiooxidans TaxID=53254 RepID=A0A1T5H2C4_9HYPH|nr:DMT family transporter [Bosea thiooxidans]SKC14834.1 Threonine/homoserine efflux transporter RhtA [Bosea thiooxidans]
MDETRASQNHGLVLALVSAAAFGTNIVSAQIAGQAGLSGPLLVFYRVLLMLVLVVAAARAWRGSLALARDERRPVLLFGLATALVGIAYLSSVAFVPVSVAAVVFYTFPILIVLAEPVLTSAPFRADRLAVALLAFLGVALVVGPDLHGLDPRGLALAMLASLGATAQFFAAARCARVATLPKLFWSHVVILPVTALVLLVTGGFLPPQSFLLAPVAVAVTYAGYVVGFLFQILALARVAPGPAGLAFCAEPVFSVAIAAFVLAERLGPLQYAGGALVIAALVTNVILEQTRRSVVPA